jgi:tRNA A37 threonylcarbamoyladenosine biosynthesis protein TsaE
MDGAPTTVLRQTPIIVLNYGGQPQSSLTTSLRTTARCIRLHRSSLPSAVSQVVHGVGLSDHVALEAEVVNALQCARDLLETPEDATITAMTAVKGVVQALLDDSYERQPEAIAIFVCQALKTVLQGWCSNALHGQLLNQVLITCLPQLQPASAQLLNAQTALGEATTLTSIVQRHLATVLQQQQLPQRNQCTVAALNLARLLAQHTVVHLTGPLGAGKHALVDVLLRCLELDHRGVQAHTLLAAGWADEALLSSPGGGGNTGILTSLLASHRQSLDLADGMDADELAAAEQPVWLVLKGRLSLPVQHCLQHIAATGQLLLLDGSRHWLPSSTRILVLDDDQNRTFGPTLSLGSINVVERGCELHELWLVQQGVSPEWAERYVQAAIDVWKCLHACTTVVESGPTYVQLIGTLQALFPPAVAAAWQDPAISVGTFHSACYMYALMWASLGQLQPDHAQLTHQTRRLESLLTRLVQDLGLTLTDQPLLEHVVQVDTGTLIHIASVLPESPPLRSLPGEVDPLNSTYIPTTRLEALRRASLYSLASGRHVGLCGPTAAGKTTLLQAVAEGLAGFDGTEARLVRFNCCSRSTVDDLWQQLRKPLDVSNGQTYHPTSQRKVLLMLDGLDHLQSIQPKDQTSATKYPLYHRDNTATASKVHPRYLSQSSNASSCMALPAIYAQQLVTEGVVLDAEGLALARPRRLTGVSMLFSCTTHQGRLINGCSLDPRLASLSTMLAVPSPAADELYHVTEQLTSQWVVSEHSRKHLNTAAVRTPKPDVAWVATLARCTVTAHEQLLGLYLPIQRRLAYR